MRTTISILFFALFSFQISAQSTDEKLKLVVGIVVDQMRYDYLTRFWDKYSEDGFKKLVTEGFNFKNNHFNYIPTSTGPGHASVFTGTSPMNHGIISNGWYDKFSDKKIYCVGDDSVSSVGTQSNAGKMSPRNLKTTTVADENRLHNQMRSKTIGIAIKDRGAILPAGHTANASYWFHGADEGKWITSSYYREELPQWVKEFNTSGIVDSYMKEWNTLYEIETYIESGPDNNTFEGGFKGKEESTFPYDLKLLAEQNNGYDILEKVAFGNDLTTDFALAAIKGENLGEDEFTDFLTLSYSSTDYVGHNFGVNSKEIQDSYLRLDRNLATLLNHLDATVGKGNYTVFLTADHGAVDVPSYLKSVKIPAGNFSTGDLRKKLENFLATSFKHNDLIKDISNNQIFLNYKSIEENGIDQENLENSVAHFILQEPHVEKVFTRTQLEGTTFQSGIPAAIQNGFHQKSSGDVLFVLEPAFVANKKQTGATHGSGFSYDTHAPLIFYGSGIKKGSTYKRSEIIDIAPTISALLGISFPNATTGNPLSIMLDK